jgi:pyrophosphate--fructose-6-phosphate 1-phosphotransferase
MVPIISLIHWEERKGKKKAVIQKTLVDLKKQPFMTFSSLRGSWRLDDVYRSVGPMQFFGKEEIVDSVPLTLSMR